MANLNALNPIIGMDVTQATAWLKKNSVTVGSERIEVVRPKVINGRPQMVTMEIADNRINVAIDNSKITALLGVG